MRTWLASVPDSRGLYEISLPGTHNSCARNASVAVENQRWTLAEQMRAGVRFLDIRIGNAELDIYHGIVSLDMHWTDVAAAVMAFLDAHPTETVVMRIKHESPDAETPRWTRWFAQHARARQYFHDNVDRAFPIALGAVRGKVVVLDDEGARFPYIGLPYGNACLRVLDEYRVWWLPAGFPCLGVTIGEKIAHVLRAVTTARKKRRQWSITYASGAVGMAPAHVADEVNTALLAHLCASTAPPAGGHVGTIVMDYPSHALIKAIVYSYDTVGQQSIWRSALV